MMLTIGPFRTGDLLIIGLVIAAIAVLSVVARGVLSLPFYIAGWIILLVLGVVVMLMILLGITIVRYWFGGREGFMFAASRATGIPLYLDVELGNNNAEFVLGDKKHPKDMTFKDEESGIKIDPTQLSKDAKAMRLPRGLDIHIFSFFNFLPQSINNHSAFKAIEIYFKEECKELNFLTVKEFVELISDPEHYLEHNALTKLNKYFKVAEKRNADGTIKTVKNAEGKDVSDMTFVRQFFDETTNKWIEQDMPLPVMIQKIANARKDISKLPCYTGPLAGIEAFVNNSVSYSSQHLSHVLMMKEEQNKIDKKNEQAILIYCIGAAIVLIGGGIAYYIVNMAGVCKAMAGLP